MTPPPGPVQQAPDDALTVQDVARLLGVSDDKARTWMSRGVIPSWDAGDGRRLWRARREDVEAFLRSRTVLARPRQAASVPAGVEAWHRHVPAELRD
jgi:excisionase family DNA binding protein